MIRRFFLTVISVVLFQSVLAQKIKDAAHIQDSIYTVPSKNIEKYITKGNRANSIFRKQIIYVDFGSAITLSLTGGYIRKLNEHWTLGAYLGYTHRYSKYELFVNNSTSFPFVNLKHRGNAFNSQNGIFNSQTDFSNALLKSIYTRGKIIGIEFNYFRKGNCFIGSSLKLGYRYKDNGIRFSQSGNAIDANTFISYSFNSISNLIIRQNQLYTGIAWQTLINNQAFFEFSINGGINVLLYSKKVISIYEKFGVDQLDQFGSGTNNQNTKPKVVISSGKQVFVPSDEGKYPIQIRPFILFNIRMGVPF